MTKIQYRLKKSACEAKLKKNKMSLYYLMKKKLLKI